MDYLVNCTPYANCVRREMRAHTHLRHCARFRKQQAMLVGKIFRLLVRHLAGTFEVRFVADEKYHSAGIR